MGSSSSRRSSRSRHTCWPQYFIVTRGSGDEAIDIVLGDMPLHGSVQFWDMPGAGDVDVPAHRLLELLESTFSNRTVHCVLPLTSRTDKCLWVHSFRFQSFRGTA